MEKRKVLILGARGMLGQELVRVYGEDEGYEVAGWDYSDIDVTDFAAAEKKIREYAPAVIVNAVAYNAVDQCEESEEEYTKAMQLNAEVPGFLARLTKDLDATLVHYSSDYVFDGESEESYAEDAEPHPLSKYGMSKLAGEKAIIEAFVIPASEPESRKKDWIPGQARDDSAESSNVRQSGYYIIRLSKLFGKPASSATAKKSFFEKMLEVAKDKKTDPSTGLRAGVTVVDDEKSCFTYAPDLALASKVLEMYQKPYGIYHLVNEGAVTWYEAAKELFKAAGIDVVVKPVSPDAFPRPAKRPHFSALKNTKFVALRPYTEALEEFLKK